MDDAALVRLALAGDREAFAVLVGRHRPMLVGLCRRVLGDRGLAEDAAQEAVLQAMVGLGRLEQPERFGAWLGGIGLNVCRRWRRDRVREDWSLAALTGGRAALNPVPAEPAELTEARVGSCSVLDH
jgi:DNA-directed RNA polymerase specialized sigma24 family protein